ncbi:MAG TPA: hypothetical protein VGR96_15650 [Acidobacteriaceae bacterium]|nr:hypothetical protein [Acidobacteriaceae bacterium]
MSIISATSPFDSDKANEWSKGSSGLAKRLGDASHFLRNFRVSLRFGELTRAPLRLLRFQMFQDLIECDWLSREPDPWDVDLPSSIGQRHASLQALKDAIEVRNLIFYCVPGVDSALLRVYRSSPRRKDELIIAGSAERSDRPARSIRSLAMRAQLLGFRFSLENDILHELPETAHLRVGT